MSLEKFQEGVSLLSLTFELLFGKELVVEEISDVERKVVIYVRVGNGDVEDKEEDNQDKRQSHSNNI